MTVFQALVAASLLGPLAAQGAPPAPVVHDEQIAYHRWESLPDWVSGHAEGTRAVPAVRPYVELARPAGTSDYADPYTGVTKSWEYASWTSPVHRIGFGASQLVASWNAETPAGTWLQVELLGRYTDGGSTPAYVMARWASGDQDIKRTTGNGQSDAYSFVDTDTNKKTDETKKKLLAGYQLKVTLFRTPGSHVTPKVWQIGAMASNVPDRFSVTPSKGGIAWGKELAVPRYSQNIHKGQYPEYNGGGEAWCSPTSTQMVVDYWGRGPSERDLAWVDPSYADPQGDHAARHTYDWAYDGTGNWPFNTAYAGSFGLKGIITRLHSLDEAERFIAAGIPVITSQSFLSSELTGANYGTAGHLFVIVGFTETGDVIVNDPASHDDSVVRNVYKRTEFENVWLRTKRHRADGTVASGSGGIACLISPVGKPWPKVSGSQNW